MSDYGLQMEGGQFLGGVLGKLGQMLPMFLGRSDDLHLLPVIAELFSAIEADDVHTGHRSGLRTARRAPD